MIEPSCPCRQAMPDARKARTHRCVNVTVPALMERTGRAAILERSARDLPAVTGANDGRPMLHLNCDRTSTRFGTSFSLVVLFR